MCIGSKSWLRLGLQSEEGKTNEACAVGKLPDSESYLFIGGSLSRCPSINNVSFGDEHLTWKIAVPDVVQISGHHATRRMTSK